MTPEFADFLLSAGSTLAETCLLFLLISFYFPKKNMKKCAFNSIFIGTWMAQLVKHFFHARYSAWMPLYSLAVDFSAICLCFKGGLRLKAVFLLVVYGVITCCESLIFSYIIAVTPEPITGLHSGDARELAVFVLSKAAQSLAVVAMARFGWIRHKLVIKRKALMLFLIIPLSGVLCIYILYPRIWFGASVPMLLILIFFSVFVLIFILILFYFIVIQAQADEQLETAKLSEHSAQSYFKEIDQIQRSLRKLLHDSRYNFLHLRSLLNRGETGKAADYIQALDDSLLSCIPSQITGNAQVDSILSYYKNIFSGAGSELGISGRLPPVLAVLPQDMARLLGNALDNALEACKGCTVSPKIVKVEFTYDKGFLSIRVTNPYENAPKRTGGRLHSTKPDGDKHGYGMAIMEELAKEYGGGIFHDAKDGVFVLRIILRDRDI